MLGPRLLYETQYTEKSVDAVNTFKDDKLGRPPPPQSGVREQEHRIGKELDDQRDLNGKVAPPVHPPVPPPVPPPAAIILGDNGVFQRKMKNVLDFRENVVKRRIDITNIDRDWRQQLRNTTEKQNRFMTFAGALMATIEKLDIEASTRQTLMTEWGQVQQSAGRLSSRGKFVESAHNELQELEGTLYSKEWDLYEDYLKKFQLQLLFSSTISEESETQDIDEFEAISAQSVSSTSTQSVEHHYYARIGDFNLMRDSIFNFESEHRRLSLIRDSQKEAGIEVHPPDVEFYEAHFKEKENLVLQYHTAKQDVERLRNSCVHQGLNVEAPNLPPLLDRSQIVERSIINLSAAPNKSKFNPDAYLLFGRADRNVPVLHWINGVHQASQAEYLDVPKRIPKTDYTNPMKEDLSKDKHMGTSDIDGKSWLPLSENNQTRASQAKSLEQDEKEQPFERIQGDPPKRRYSEPTFPAFTQRLQDGTLKWHHMGHFDVYCKSCLEAEKSDSIR